MRKQFNQKERHEVWQKYSGRCAYCGIKITVKNMQIDHIKAVIFGGTNGIENLNPACKDCNLYKGASSIETFRAFTKQMLNEKLHYLFKSKTKMQVAINFGAIELKKWDGKFYFEKIH
jgi:5-methylcytosine-specific restriction endonuclease McrA